MLMRMAILTGLALALAVAAGCGSDDGGTGDEKPALAGPLTYERGGGLAGRRDRLVLQPDGTAKVTAFGRTREVELAGKELDRVAAALDSAELSSLPARSTSPKPVPDAFGYRIQYGTSEVTTDDPAMPEKLRALVARLGAIVDRYDTR
jgi:hypothetical protein